MMARGKDRTGTGKRPPTQKDVAELAGVSVMAVSTVVTGNKSTVGVSEATRVRILKAIEELQYRPNIFARSLRVQRTGTIGFYNGFGYINAADPFIRTIYHNIAVGLQEYDQDILIYNGTYKDRRDSLIERVLSQKIDAIIIFPTHDDDALIDALKSRQIPAVVIAEPVPGLTSITADDAGGSAALARHILSRGHRRILYRRSATPFLFEARRFEAFRSVVEDAGGTVIPCAANDGMDNVTSEEEDLLCRPSSEQVTAAVCWRDHSAIRVYDFCAAKGIHVPDDLSIAGFDGLQYAGATCDLTTVEAYWNVIAHRAPELIDRMLKGADLPDHTVVPAALHIGATA